MISIWHLLILAVILIVILGPSRLEKMGPSLGRAIKGFKDGLNGKDEESERLAQLAAQIAREKLEHKKDT